MSLVQKKIYLDEETNKIVKTHQMRGGFGGKGVSAAIRNIICEWADLTRFSITDAGREALAENTQDSQRTP